MMRIAVLGSTGMLGSKITELGRAGGHEVLAPSHQEADLTLPLSLEKLFREKEFEILVNCAAYTRVDACEDPAQYPQAVSANATGVGELARLSKQTKRILVHFSTDYVFNGMKKSPYVETDPVDPINAYGRTKWMGEKLVLEQDPHFYILRTSWLYGPGGTHFVKTI